MERTLKRTDSGEDRDRVVKRTGEFPLLTGFVRFRLQHHCFHDLEVVLAYIVLAYNHLFNGCQQKTFIYLFISFLFPSRRILSHCAFQLNRVADTLQIRELTEPVNPPGKCNFRKWPVVSLYIDRHERRTVQCFLASFLRLGLENVEDCSADEEVGEREDDQR